MPYIQTAFSLVFNLIGVASTCFFATVIVLMYTDPVALETLLITTGVLFHDAVGFIQTIDINLPF